LHKINICGAEIDNLSKEEAIEKIGSLVDDGSPHIVVTPNVDHIVKIQNNKNFREIYSHADLVLADGMPLIWASKYLGTPIREKLSGSDLFPLICDYCSKKNLKVFLLGGREGAAQKTAELLVEDYPDLQISGYYSPPFGFEKDAEENEKIITMIKTSNPHILFVGLGAPKQEFWISKNMHSYNVPVSIGIGVTFEFYARMIKRAPNFMQKIGFEWFWRLLMEPQRLWRRYLVDDMKIFKLVYRQKKSSKR